MKNLSGICYCLSPIVLMILVCLSSCGGKNDPAPTEKNMTLLTNGTWVIQTVSVDDVDRTDLFNGLTLKFDAKKITASNGGPVWGESQTWKFSDGTGLNITRGDGVEVTLRELTSKSLKLSFTWEHTIIDGGRARSVSGQHVFQFKK